MAALAEGAAGTLRVGIYQSVGARLLPALVRRFRQQWPLVGVRVREESAAADLLRLLEHGELDLTFADLPLREGPFEWAELLQDPYVLLVSARSELASLEAAPSLREVAKLPLIGRRSTDEPERFLEGRVPEVNVVFRTDDNGTLAAFVAEDLGAAIEPRLVVDPRDRDVKMLPFGSRIPPRTLVLAWHRDRYRSQAAQAFVELAQELAAGSAD
jgi:DNA-binding transcriptional LysR family regulator